MSFTTLYTSDGQPWSVPTSEVNAKLRQGFWRENPLTRTTEESPEVKTNVPSASSSDQLRINSESLAAIAKALPKVGTAGAKIIRDNRPYASIEDLIAKAPLDGVDWVSLSALISFE